MIVKNLKNNKSPGEDKITNEHIKVRGQKLIKMLTHLFNGMQRTSYIPKQWKYSNIIVIFKKGGRHKIENYRPISLSPTIAKIFSKLIEKRISAFVISHQPLEQAGF